MAKEFDFDELDKAVNSLMKDTEPEASNPSIPAAEESPVAPPVAPPVVEPLPPATPVEPTPPEVAAPISTSAVPTKPSGRFMDVVHPSSDMRTTSPTVSREGAALAPISSVSTPTELSKPTVTPVEPEAIPDPVTLPPAPLTSPFLPDAQVEKRPLGSLSSEAPINTSLNEAIAAELSTDSEPTSSETTVPTATTESEPAIATDVAATEPAPEPELEVNEDPAPENEKETIGLPEELSNDLVAIESGEAQPESEEQGEASVDNDSNANVPPSSAATLLSQASIPQQYKEEASTTTETHAPIYDDQSTAQAVTQPAKKGNKTRILLIAVIAIVVGIAGAVGLYFLQISS